ncbi:MAG: rhodanese-like domain-containing protein [Clostridia bacterium]|nr:rhodanese-like domain-containing protein [Clostridia bacterium]
MIKINRRFCCRAYNGNTISESELLSIIKKYRVTIIDVRSRQEFNEGHFSGAINIPLCEIRKTIGRIVPNKDEIIVAYCTAGVRSARAISILKALGYRNLYNYIYQY